jgi:ABC-type glycerol-3-phosphate transport system substrate-binding protein
MKLRFLALVVLGAWLAGALSGCGVEDSAPTDQTVITFAYPSYLTAFNQANYQKLAEAFNDENPDLRVELREVSTQELQELMARGADYVDLLFDPESGMDVFLSRAFQSYVESERLLALDPLLAAHPEIDLDDFYPLALDQLRSEGQLRGLPTELDLAVLYYNRDLFDQVGVAYPAAGWTRDDFLAAAVALRKGLPEKVIAFGGQADEAVPFLYAHGGAVRRGAGYALTDPRTVEAVRWYTDLALVHGVMPLPAQWEAYQPGPGEGSITITTIGGEEAPEAERRWGSIGAMAEMAAQEGDVALWSAPLSERQGTGGWDWDFQWGIVPWPRDQVEIVVPYALAYFVPASTPDAEAALRWIDFLTRQPPQLKGIPARRSVAGSEEVRRAWNRDVGAEAYDACLASIGQATPVDYSLYYLAERALGQALLDVLEGGLDAETALSQAHEALEAEP